MSRFGFILALAALFSAAPTAGLAQLSDIDRSRLAGEIDAAAKNLDASLFPDLDECKAELRSRADSARGLFDRTTSAENRDAWLRYLDLDPLVEAIQFDKSPAVIGREAVDLRFRLVGTSPGLELTALRNLRDAVEQLIEAVRFRDKERSKESLAKQLESLAQRVRELDDSPSADDFASISALMGVLESSGQAKGLIYSLRNTFSRPNLAILVSEPMVQTAIGRNVDETRPVRDCILGTRIVGNASLNGVITANLLPAVGAARINVTLAGHVISNNIGYNGPVRLRTVGYGDVNVSRSMTFNESGVTLEPAYAHAVLKTEIKAIEHKLRLVRNIARKRAAEQKPKADRIAVEKMRSQVGTQFANRFSKASGFTPTDVLAEVRPVLKRLSLEEPSRLWGSTDQAIFIDSAFRRRDQLGSVVSRPPISESYDVAIQIHESVIDNAFAPVLAGRTLKESQINKLLSESGRPVAAMKTDDEGEPEPPFEIDFARLRPIIFESRNQTVRLGVRGTRFAQGNRELKQAMEITALYEPAKTQDGVAILLRKGDVDVDFPGRKRLSVSQAGLRRTIQKKFSDVFPEVVLDRPLEVPQDVKLEAIKGRVFRARLVDARNGWLTIAAR